MAVDSVSEAGWCDLFHLFVKHPEARQAWRDLVEWLVEHPSADLMAEAELAGFGNAPDGWRTTVADLAGDASQVPEEAREGRQRYVMGLAMDELRGRVPAL